MNESEDLLIRKQACKFFIKTLQGIDDPRSGDAIAEYQRQLAVIEQKIAEQKAPPPVVVGLKSATLSAINQ